PAGNQIVRDYDNSAGASVTVTRGGSIVVTALDGFGRPVGTSNSVGVRTSTTYDAEGRKTFESLPFSGASADNRGDRIEYDALGRIKSRRHGDDTIVEMHYELGSAGYDVRMTDENGHVTVQRWTASGDPSEARLTSLRDANDNEWRYEYHVTGALAKVIAPDTVGYADSNIDPRAWIYNSQNQLASETHPESGTTSYTQYDGAGIFKTKVDQPGTTFSYEYDDDNRVKRVTAAEPTGSQVTNVEYWPNSDLRKKVEIVGGASVVFDYDAANRLKERTE